MRPSTPAALHIDAPASDDPLDVLPFAARAYPRETLVLVRADADSHACGIERLLRALECDGVLGAAALDDIIPERTLLDVVHDDDHRERIDALCFAYGERRLIDAPLRRAAFSAWDGERLAQLGHASPARCRRARRARFPLRAARSSSRACRADACSAETRDRGPTRSAAALTSRGVARAHLRLRFARARRRIGRASTRGRSFCTCCTAGVAAPNAGCAISRARSMRPAISFWSRAAASSASRHGEWIELHDGAMLGPPRLRIALPVPIADTALADNAYREILAGIVRDHCVDAVVVSSLIGHSLDVLATRLPTFCVIHDHYPLWPTLHRDFGDATLALRRRAARARSCRVRRRCGIPESRSETLARVARGDRIRAPRSRRDADRAQPLGAEQRAAPCARTRRAAQARHRAWTCTVAGKCGRFTRKRRSASVRACSCPGACAAEKARNCSRSALSKLREHADLYLVGAGRRCARAVRRARRSYRARLQAR